MPLHIFPSETSARGGSGSFDIKVEVGKHLVGGGIYFELLSLDFEDVFSEYKRVLTSFILTGREVKAKVAFENEFKNLLEEYLIFGGFPRSLRKMTKRLKKSFSETL
ncbi:MAG: hypothetical protein HA496_01575 [Thaumarchaeota archaeon]|nr:hypothetical protein [Nitrososphaerota archaeon]